MGAVRGSYRKRYVFRDSLVYLECFEAFIFLDIEIGENPHFLEKLKEGVSLS